MVYGIFVIVLKVIVKISVVCFCFSRNVGGDECDHRHDDGGRFDFIRIQGCWWILKIKLIAWNETHAPNADSVLFHPNSKFFLYEIRRLRKIFLKIDALSALLHNIQPTHPHTHMCARAPYTRCLVFAPKQKEGKQKYE